MRVTRGREGTNREALMHQGKSGCGCRWSGHSQEATVGTWGLHVREDLFAHGKVCECYAEKMVSPWRELS